MSKFLSVPQSEWRQFFDRVSRALLGKWAEIEVTSLDLGDQIVAEWVPLFGISYDVNGDLLDIALDRSSHRIPHPREILVEEGPTGLTTVAIVDADGSTQVVRLREPLALPAASAPPLHA
jgi:hypothetical protein